MNHYVKTKTKNVFSWEPQKLKESHGGGKGNIMRAKGQKGKGAKGQKGKRAKGQRAKPQTVIFLKRELFYAMQWPQIHNWVFYYSDGLELRCSKKVSGFFRGARRRSFYRHSNVVPAVCIWSLAIYPLQYIMHGLRWNPYINIANPVRLTKLIHGRT